MINSNKHYHSPNSFYGNRKIYFILMKNSDCLAFKRKRKSKKGGAPHIYNYSRRNYFFIAKDYATLFKPNKYPKAVFSSNEKKAIERDRKRIEKMRKATLVCPQITPPKKYQKPMLNAKIKPYKNLAGNKID